MTRATLQKQTEPPHVGVVLHVAHVGGKPLRFFAVHENGMARTFVVFEDFATCLNFSRQQRRRHLRKMHSTRWREKVIVTHIDGVELTLAPRWMAEAIVGHGRKYLWLDETIASQFEMAVAMANIVARERVAA
jgi:hypothetical protein